jgi:hypothetical protein
MCKRSTDDPLVRLFLDRYGLNLLPIPRESAAVGDLYVYDGRRVSPPGNVTYFLDPPPEMPELTTGERMADVEGVMSSGFSLDLGLGLLEGFFMAFGAGALADKVTAEYRAQETRSLRFRITEATRDFVDPFKLGMALIGRRLLTEHPMWSEDNRYYLVTGVARTPSISVVAENGGSSGVQLDVEALKVVGATGALTLERSSEYEVVYKGDRLLAFGVELCELSYEPKRSSLRLKMPEGALPGLKGASGESSDPGALRAFIGENEGDAFIRMA